MLFEKIAQWTPTISKRREPLKNLYIKITIYLVVDVSIVDGFHVCDEVKSTRILSAGTFLIIFFLGTIVKLLSINVFNSKWRT